jgi:cytoskeletal protein CcmA (bactofilin family)
MKDTRKYLSILVLAILFALTFITPARAFDGRSGDKVVIAAGEVINDDLYVSSQEFELDGTVNGDVVALAQMVTINGKVDGDLIAAGQTVVVNGTVTGSVRMAGAVLFLGEKASIGRDIVGAGYSLEIQQGSRIEKDIVFTGGQILLAGDVARNVEAYTAAFELRGTVGGDVKADVGEAGQGQAGPPPIMFIPQSTITTPNVKTGLTVDPSAKIEGNLEYTQSNELTFPAGVVSGKVTRTAPALSGTAVPVETSGQKVAKWGLGFVRNSISLILIGLFLLWLFPYFVNGLRDNLLVRPWSSLGWGMVTWVAFFFGLLLVAFVMILGAILFGVLTLGQLSGTVIWVGLLALFGLVVGFMVVTSFVAKVVFGAALGKWMLARTNSPMAEHKYWPMVIGVLVTLVVISLLSFPLIPSFLGGFLNFAVVLFGLGTLWLWGRERMMKKSV